MFRASGWIGADHRRHVVLPDRPGRLDVPALPDAGRGPGRAGERRPEPAGPGQVQRGLSSAGGGRLVLRPGAGGRRAEAPGGAGPGAPRHGAGQRRRHHADGAPHDLPGHRRDARADDRAGRHGLRDDPVLPRHRHGRLVAPGERPRPGDLDGALRHPGGDRGLDPGDLLPRAVPQPDRAALAGGRDDGRAAAGAIRAGGADDRADLGTGHRRRTDPSGALAARAIPSPSAPRWRRAPRPAAEGGRRCPPPSRRRPSNRIDATRSTIPESGASCRADIARAHRPRSI